MLLTSTILLIHESPYSDTELRMILPTQGGCPMPCFLNIQPGKTSLAEAMTILETSGWVEKLNYSEYTGWLNVQWRWSAAAPSIFRSEELSYGGGLGVDKDLIAYIEIKTTIPLGDTRLIWGAPENFSYLMTLGPIGYTPPKPFIYLYPNMVIESSTDCPYLRHFWNSAVTFIVGDINAWLNSLAHTAFTPPEKSFSRFVVETTQNFCQPVL
jgi:hypothetical protein